MLYIERVIGKNVYGGVDSLTAFGVDPLTVLGVDPLTVLGVDPLTVFGVDLLTVLGVDPALYSVLTPTIRLFPPAAGE